MDTVTSGKIGALFALIALTFAFGSMPFLVVSRRARSLMSSTRQEQVIKYLNCFGGGVFLGALLLHLMVEGSEEFDEFKEEAGFDNDYPFFNLFVAVGFFTVAFIECFIHGFLLARHDDVESSIGHSHHGNHETQSASGGVKSASTETGISVVSGQYGSLMCQQTTMSSSSPDHHHHVIGNDCNGDTFPEQKDKTTAGPSQKNSSPSTDDGSENGRGAVMEHGESCAVAYSYASTASPIRAFLLLVAFSFHTIFDGLAVGLQESNFQLWEMFTAIAIHKCIVAFCLGMELFSKYATAPKKAFLWIGLFSLMSPVGICIGIYLTSGGVNTKARHLSSGILQGLAAGTFMYVTFLEILSYYWKQRGNRHFLDIFFSLIGFGCMAGVKYLDKD